MANGVIEGSASDKFASEVVATEPVTRRMIVREYIRDVGRTYIWNNQEKVLLDWWERGVRNG